jgi:hypothetical protein
MIASFAISVLYMILFAVYVYKYFMLFSKLYRMMDV